MKHRKTDPACRKYKRPTSSVGIARVLASRGRICQRCADERGWTAEERQQYADAIRGER